MKSKKLFALILATLSLTLAGCNNAAGGGNNNSSSKYSYSEPDNIKVNSVTLSKNDAYLPVGESMNLTVNVGPYNAYNRAVVWSTSDMTVASVNDGKVTARGRGAAIITCTSVDDPSVYDECYVYTMPYFTTMIDPELPADIVVECDQPYVFEGERLDVHVSYDKQKYKFYGAVAYALTASYKTIDLIVLGTWNDGYYLIAEDMGQDLYYISAEFEEITETPPAPVIETYDIYNLSYESVGITDLNAGEAAEGETVEFGIALISGFELDTKVEKMVRVVTFDEDDKLKDEIEVIPTNQKYHYSFIMPADDVYIYVATQGAYFPVYKNDPNGMIDGIYTADAETLQLANYNGSYVQYYSNYLAPKLKANSKDLDREYPVGIRVAETGEEYYDEYGNFPYILMPTYPFAITLEPITEVRYNNFTLKNSEHVTLEAYEKDADGNYVAMDEAKVIYGDTIYFKANCEDSYMARKVKINPYKYYAYKSSSSSTVTEYYYGYSNTTDYRSEATLAMNADGYYEYTLTHRPSENIVVEVVEANEHALDKTPLEGTYNGFYANKAANRSDFTFSAVFATEIKANGEAMFGTDERTIVSWDPVTNTGVMTELESGTLHEYLFAYKDGILITSEQSDAVLGRYPNVYVKAETYGEHQSEYRVYGEMFGNGSYFALQVEHQDQPYKTLFIDFTRDNFYVGVDYHMESGVHVCDTDAAYNFVAGGQDYVVGYYANGGAANRGMLAADAVRGVFKAENGKTADIELDGFGHVKYDGVAINAKIDGNTISWNVKEPARGTVSVTLRPALGTYYGYTFTESTGPELAGKTYGGSFYRGYSASSSGTNKTGTWQVKFVDDEHVIVKGWNSTYYTTDSYLKMGNYRNDECTYSVDGDEITINFYASQYYSSATTLVSWTFIYDEDADALRLKSGVKYQCCVYESTSSYSDYYYNLLDDALVMLA